MSGLSDENRAAASVAGRIVSGGDPYGSTPLRSLVRPGEPGELPLRVLSDILADKALLQEPQWRVDGLWPLYGNLLIAAEAKAGKTTLSHGLIRSLADGVPFLGREVRPVDGRVVVLDLELSPSLMARWLRDLEIENTDRVAVASLRGRASMLNLSRRPEARALRAALEKQDAEVLILDCLRPALDAAGMSEDKEASRYIGQLAEVAMGAGVQEIILIHHVGNDPRKVRGDTGIQGWPDAIWKLSRSRSGRTLEVLGRDVLQEHHPLRFDEVTRRYAMADATKGSIEMDDRVSHLDSIREAAREVIGGFDGPNQTHILKELRKTFCRNDIVVALDLGEQEGWWFVDRSTPTRGIRYYLAPA